MVECKYFIAQLRACRKNAGLSTSQVAEKVNRSKSAVEAWESGRSQPSADILILLCKLYEVDVTAFFPPEVTQDSFQSIESIPKQLDDPILLELIDLWSDMDQRGRDAIMALARSLSLDEGYQHQVDKTA